jgi:glycosyltransferase involved in cell wall biosynthesis
MGDDKVTVVSACTGSKSVLRAISSVRAQTCQQIIHLLCVDGPAFAREFDSEVVPHLDGIDSKRRILHLPWNTGHSEFYGYRIYAMSMMIVDTPWIAFLDQDAYYEPDHIEELLSLCESNKLQWAFSQRRVVDLTTGESVEDNCESIGPEVSWVHQRNAATRGLQPLRPWSNLVDTNSYLISRELAPLVGGQLVQHRLDPTMRKASDRVLLEALRRSNAPYMCSGHATVVWPVNDPAEKMDGHRQSNNTWRGNRDMPIDFFKEGNAFMRAKYGSQFPWKARCVLQG